MSYEKRLFKNEHNDALQRIDVRQSVSDMRMAKDKMSDNEFCLWYSRKYWQHTKLSPAEVNEILKEKKRDQAQ